jgi:hypothetical protein
MDVAHQHMLSARAHGGDQMDWTALVGGERISAGLQPFGSRVCFLFLSYSLLLLSPSLFLLFLSSRNSRLSVDEKGEEDDQYISDGG